MDGHGYPEADIESVSDGDVADPFLSWEKPEDCDSHCEGDGRVGGRPAPKHPAAQQAEFENMGQVRANAVRRMDTVCISKSDAPKIAETPVFTRLIRANSSLFFIIFACFR